jgi:hypothetical protein
MNAFTEGLENNYQGLELKLIKKLKQGDKILCTDSFKDKFIKGERYEFLEIDNNKKIIIKYIKYKNSSKNIKIKVNVKYKMSLDTFLKHFNIYNTIKPDITDNEFEWDWED